MSTWWSFKLLCQPGRLTTKHVLAVIAELGKLGYDAPGGGEASVVCVAADGSGSLLFDSLEAAADWLAADEGLLSLRNADLAFDLDLSLHRRGGILRTELEHLPDEPLFDVLALTVSESAFESPARDHVWARVNDALVAALLVLPFAFAFGLDEPSSEAVARFSCVHRRVAMNQLPPFLPWLSAVEQNSGLSAQLDKAANVVGRPVERRRGIRLLLLTDGPWNACSAVLKASSQWREATGDAGCS